MCGIAGYASTSESVRHQEWLLSASNKLSHRGPDDSGVWFTEGKSVGLAHRRLAIFDLSPLGAQPMSTPDRSITITFNGEIYNFLELRKQLSGLGYGFRSTSDTEVILAAYQQWGQNMLSKLIGMFAFAIVDMRRNEIFIARDRAGEKPLYYRVAKNSFSFASELRALAENSGLSLNVNLRSLEHYLAYGYSPGSETLLDKHFKLPPGHFMIVDLETLHFDLRRYWDVPSFDSQLSNSRDELADELEELLADSVSMQLAADVPVGILLSGGLDSSLITAFAARHGGLVNTFTVAMTDSPSLDESAHANLIANHFSTNHTVLSSELADSALIESIAAHIGEPIADSSIIPTYLVAREVKKSCTVALGGDGGDELFGGYSHYQMQLKHSRQHGRLAWLFAGVISSGAENFLPLGFPGRNMMMSLQREKSVQFSTAATHFDNLSRKRLLSSLTLEPRGPERFRSSSFPCESDLVRCSTLFDFRNYLPEDILVKVDRASMMNSLEVRAPFLDHRLIEFAFSKVPSSQKVTETNKKILLKSVAERLLPAEFDHNRKQGFSIPLAAWLKRGPIREMFWSHLASSDSMFNVRFVEKMLRNQDLGFRNSERLFALLQFEIWRKTLGVSGVSESDA